MRPFSLAASLVVLLGLGCATTYSPDPDTYEIDEIPEFRSSGSVALVNEATSSEVFLSSNGFERWFGDPQEFTGAAIALAGRALKERGMQLGGSSERRLGIAVEDLRGETSAGGFAFRVSLKLRVETGDGLTRSFEGTNRSTYFARAADGAVMRGVTAMLADPEITAYLTR